MKLDLDYDKHDILEVEIETDTFGIVWDYGLIKFGKSIIEISGQNLPKLLALTCDEEEIKEIRNSKLQYENLKARVMKEIEERSAKEIGYSSEVEKEKFFIKNFPLKRFIEDNGREPKPIKKLKILSNKGPRIDDMVASQKKTIETNAQMSQVLTLLTQMLQNQNQTNNNKQTK